MSQIDPSKVYQIPDLHRELFFDHVMPPASEPVAPGIGRTIGRVIGFIASFLGSVGAAYYIGGIIAYEQDKQSGLLAMVYIGLGLVILAASFLLFRKTRVWSSSKWALLGLIIGCGAAILGEGICFTIGVAL